MLWRKINRPMSRAVLLFLALLGLAGVLWPHFEESLPLWFNMPQLGEALVWLWVGVNLGEVVLM